MLAGPLNANPPIGGLATIFEIGSSVVSQKKLQKRTSYNQTMHIFIDNSKFEVEAGFIPARSTIRAGPRAGINPAPTRKKHHSSRKMAHDVFANISGTQH